MLILALMTLAAESDKKPSMAFLEYLASLEKVDGKLVGPMDMLEDEKPEKTNAPLSKANGKVELDTKMQTESKLVTEKEGEEHD